MSNVTSLAVDLAKNVFQLYGIDANRKEVLKKRIKRSQLLEFMANLNPCDVYMEGCGSANYWGRKFKELGHKVKLINPKYVKPYVKRNKNDLNDAAGIISAAYDPNMKFSEVKNEEQQDVQSTHRIRSRLISQRTALANQIRGLLAEYGITIPKGISNISKHLPRIIGNNEGNFSGLMLGNLISLHEDFMYLNKKLASYDEKIDIMFKSNEVCQRLKKIPGIGRIGATILAAVLGNGAGFKNGRHFAAFLGLVPKEHSSGDQKKLLGISKGGDTYIRTVLIHGARAAVRCSKGKDDPHSKWINCLKTRAANNVTAVALANKTARIAWAIVHGNGDYNPNHKPPEFADPAINNASEFATAHNKVRAHSLAQLGS